MWYIVIFKANIDASITNNKLSTEGIFLGVQPNLHSVFIYLYRSNIDC